MMTPAADFKKVLKNLSDREKDALLLRAIKRDDELHEALRFELLEDVTLASVQAEAEDRIHELFSLNLSGFQLARFLPKTVAKAQKEVARARRITKSKQLEADLDMYLLRLLFRNYSGALGSSHAMFYKSVARLAVRTANLVLKNLHEDYWLEYKGELDDFFQRLRAYDNRWQLSFELPQELQLPD